MVVNTHCRARCPSSTLFNVRYLHVPSFTLTGVRGTKAIYLALAVVAGQFAFTYLPFMNAIFGSRPLTLGEGR
jgi:hypothetical protein